MASDEIIEELQKIAYQSNGMHKRLAPEDKENLHELDRVRQLETRLDEVVKENETLIDELQDKKLEVYKLKNKTQTWKEVYDDVELALEDKIAEMMKRMGNSKKNISTIQSLISKTMSDFRTKITSESESDVWNYQGSLKKSESFQPLTGRQHLKKSSSNSSASQDTSKSIQGTYSHTFDTQYLASKSKIYEKSVRNTPNLTMKSITNKSNNASQNKSAKKGHKSSISQKQLSSCKKPNASKYLNYMDSQKKRKEMNDHVNIVPLNGYVPDIIQHEMRQSHK